MTLSAQASAFLRVPAGLLSEVELARARQTLVIHPRKMEGEEAPAPIAMYRNLRDGGISVPLHWGLNEWPDLPVEDATSRGQPLAARRLPDPNHPKAGDGQGQFMGDILAALNDNYAVLAKAATGTGKTVSALWAAAQLGVSTIVFVHMDRLADQWEEEAIRHLGLKRSEVGRIQGDRCEFDRPLVIAMLQSLHQRDYPAAMFRAFGFSIFDEVHRAGARTFAASLSMFPTAYKLALSATPTRKDGAEKAFLWQFGAPTVQLQGEALRARVVTVPFVHRYVVPNLKHGGMVRYLTRNRERNRLCASEIMGFVERDRNVLIIGDSIRHLQGLRAECIKRGMPEEKSGLFVGYLYTGNDRWRVRKATPGEPARAAVVGQRVIARRPFVQAATEVVSIDRVLNYAIVVGKTAAGEVVAVPPSHYRIAERVPQTRMMKAEEKARVLRTASYIFTTYGQFQEGIDVARLDAGIDVSPRSSATQVIGRIRRKLEGATKPMPEWRTILDVGCSRAERYFKSRLKDYKQGNCEVVR